MCEPSPSRPGTPLVAASYVFFMVRRVTRIGQPKGAKLEPSQATPGRHLRLGSIFFQSQPW